MVATPYYNSQGVQYTCNTLQHTCNALQHTCNSLQLSMCYHRTSPWLQWPRCQCDCITFVTRCNTLATHCNSLATHCNNPCATTVWSRCQCDCITFVTRCNTWRQTCNTLQLTATHCNTLQHFFHGHGVGVYPHIHTHTHQKPSKEQCKFSRSLSTLMTGPQSYILITFTTDYIYYWLQSAV